VRSAATYTVLEIETEIKTKRVRKQKTDREDARLMLKLLRENRFPKIEVPCPKNCDLRQLLWHRHRLVQKAIAGRKSCSAKRDKHC
jgi:Transposase